MRARRLPRLLAVLAIAGGVIVATAAPAWAHAVLQTTSPDNGAVLLQSPSRVTLNFNEHVEISLGSVRLFNCAGNRVGTGAPEHGASDSQVILGGIPRLGNGTYVVSWRVISADSHPVHGAFSFQVGAGTGPGLAGCSTAGANAKSSTTVGVLYAVERTTLYAGLALLIGGAVFFVLIARGTSAAPKTLLLTWIGWTVVAVATIGGILLQGPYGAGSGVGDAVRWAVVDDILKSRYGHIAELRLLLLVLAFAVVYLLGRANTRKPIPTPLWLGGAVVGLAIAATPGLAGHASTGDNVIFAVPLDTLHVAAMCVWFGGLAALIVAALGGGFSGGLRRALVTFSRLAFWCVVVLVVTGLFAAWRQVGFSVDGFLHTSYGNILLVKVGLVAVLVGAAAISRSIVRKRRAAPLHAPDSVIATIDTRTVTGLRQSVGLEVLLGVAILLVTALLVNAQPARTVLAPKLFATEIKAGTGDDAMLIDVTIDPSRAGPNAIHIYALTPQGASLTVRSISASMSLPSKGIDDVQLPLQRGGPNHFLSTSADIPLAGKWQLVIHVLRTAFDDVAGTTTVPIR